MTVTIAAAPEAWAEDSYTEMEQVVAIGSLRSQGMGGRYVRPIRRWDRYEDEDE